MCWWCAAAVGSHDFPEHAVVHMTATVVAHGGADVLGNLVQVHDKFADAAVLDLGVFLERGVEVVDIGGMMLVMMDFHRFGVNMWFQSIVRVREGGVVQISSWNPPKILSVNRNGTNN